MTRLVNNPDNFPSQAVLYAKPTTVINPDFVWKATDKWIVFPWSAKPPVGQR